MTSEPAGSSASTPALRRRLGQHHLRDPRLCRPLIEFLRPIEAPVLEIGSGGGVLTRALLSAGANVVAMELDLAWLVQARLRVAEESPEAGAVRWLAADATRFAWEALPVSWPVVGNLPYNVATPILRAVLEHGMAPSMCFLLQQEVAERITAAPGSRRYGLLSLLVEWWAEASTLAAVRPGSFHPPPKVDSQFVGLVRRRSASKSAEYRRVMELAQLAFGHRRKTLVNALRERYRRDQVTAWTVAAGLPSDVRPERLSLDHYRSLAAALRSDPS